MRLWAAVHGQNERITLALLLMKRPDEDAFQVEAIARLVFHDLLCRAGDVSQPGIRVRQAPWRLLRGFIQRIYFRRMVASLADHRQVVPGASRAEVAKDRSPLERAVGPRMDDS